MSTGSAFDGLLDFVEKRMRMSHVYQPVMLITLLRSNGKASEREIAKALLGHDQSQIEYYEKVTRDMVGRVLRSHGIVERDKKTYELRYFDELSEENIRILVGACRRKLDEYIAKRGERIWKHREMNLEDISGTLRYEVLKAARFRCELCGISAEEKALQVDHIIPRKHGGSNDITNLQSLCYSCNAMKQHRDDTDFRQIRESYDRRAAGCLFCELPTERVVAENALAVAIRDQYPVTDLHMLVIPKRHVSDYFDLGTAELSACGRLLAEARSQLLRQDSTIAGFNTGTNSGTVAGQTVFHCHIHLIPRRHGDHGAPRGGVRHVIPVKGAYG